MLLNLPIILSSNSFYFTNISFVFLLFFIFIYSPPRSTIKQLTIKNYIIHTQLATLYSLTSLKTVLFINCYLCYKHIITETSPNIAYCTDLAKYELG